MTKEQAKFIEIVTVSCGNQDIDVRDDYSGRGMYGAKTYGVVVNSLPILLADCINYMREMALVNNESVINNVPDFDEFRTDNMAMDTILY